MAYSGVSVLRQQIKPDHRVHGIVEGKNWAANGQYRMNNQLFASSDTPIVIPDYAKMRWYVRAPSRQELKVLRERVHKCFM